MSDLLHAKVPDQFIRDVFGVKAATPRHTYQILTKRPLRAARMAGSLEWPTNIWMGVTVEGQESAWRAETLARVPAAVRFISAEPLLGPIALDLAEIDWLIAGGESGQGHRLIDKSWVGDLQRGCKAAGTTFFFKQWGGAPPKSGGRLLDGRTWDELPVPQ